MDVPLSYFMKKVLSDEELKKEFYDEIFSERTLETDGVAPKKKKENAG